MKKTKILDVQDIISSSKERLCCLYEYADNTPFKDTTSMSSFKFS